MSGYETWIWHVTLQQSQEWRHIRSPISKNDNISTKKPWALNSGRKKNFASWIFFWLKIYRCVNQEHQHTIQKTHWRMLNKGIVMLCDNTWTHVVGDTQKLMLQFWYSSLSSAAKPRPDTIWLTLGPAQEIGACWFEYDYKNNAETL